jgi:hypothetical protein
MFPAHALQDVLTQLASLENEHLSIMSTKLLKNHALGQATKGTCSSRRDDMVVPGGVNTKNGIPLQATCNFSKCIIKGTH